MKCAVQTLEKTNTPLCKVLKSSIVSSTSTVKNAPIAMALQLTNAADNLAVQDDRISVELRTNEIIKFTDPQRMMSMEHPNR
jgi:hypothetical protein